MAQINRRRCNALLAGALVFGALVGPAAFSQPLSSLPQNDPPVRSWRQIETGPGPAPEPRTLGTAIYDSHGRRLIVFGGAGSAGVMNDIWAFDLASLAWTRLQTTGGPPAPRLGHNAVYDVEGRKMVVWAGQQGSRFYNDTWELRLDTLEWREVTPASRPRARYGSASVYDPETRSMVIFAGFTSEAGRYQDSQAFDIATGSWTDWTPAGEKPEIRCLHTAAFEEAGRRMVVFGGQRSGPLDDLWAFDLAQRVWTRFNPAVRPPARFFSTSYVDHQGRFVVFGGFANNRQANDTWAFDFSSGEWTQIPLGLAPPPRDGMMGAYIKEEDRFVIFGGRGATRFNDLWELPGI